MAEYRSIHESIIARARSNGRPDPEAALHEFLSEISKAVAPRIKDLGWKLNDPTQEVQSWYEWRCYLAVWIDFFGDDARKGFPGIEPKRPQEYTELCTIFEDLPSTLAKSSDNSNPSNALRLTSDDLRHVELQDKENGEWILFEEWEKRNNAHERQLEREKVCDEIQKKFDETVTPMLNRHRNMAAERGYYPSH